MQCKMMTVVNIAVDGASGDLYFDWLLFLCPIYLFIVSSCKFSVFFKPWPQTLLYKVSYNQNDNKNNNSYE